MPGINTYVEELEQIDITSTSSPQQVDMIRDVLTTGLMVQVDADITISGGTTSGTLLTETFHNLLEWIMCEKDGDEFVEKIPGRMFAAFQRYVAGRPPRFTTFSNGDAQANTALQAKYFIPFSLPLLVNPWETVGYFGPVKKTFKFWVKRISTVDYSTFFSGGDRTLTVNSLTVRIFQHYAKRPTSYRPVLLPRYTVEDSDAIAASQSHFRFDVQHDPSQRLAFILQGALRDGVGVDDIINSVTFESDRQKGIIDDIIPALLTTEEERFYPGIDASAGSTESGTHQGRPVGYHGYNFLADVVGSRFGMGKARMAVRADRPQGYRFDLDVTRTSGTEIIRHMNVLLESVPGWTKL